MLTSSELQLGIEQKPGKWRADWPAFKARWDTEEQVVAVFRSKDFDAHELSMRIVYKEFRYLAVVNP